VRAPADAYSSGAGEHVPPTPAAALPRASGASGCLRSVPAVLSASLTCCAEYDSEACEYNYYYYYYYY
jgi:hypothetical protein